MFEDGTTMNRLLLANDPLQEIRTMNIRNGRIIWPIYSIVRARLLFRRKTLWSKTSQCFSAGYGNVLRNKNPIT